MRRAVACQAKGTWPTNQEVATATLPFGERFRRRIRLTDDAGEPFLLDLERALVLADGAGLRLAEGGFIRVVAAAEDVMEIEVGCARELARVAWHLGNRHVPLEIVGDRTLRIAADPALAAMLAGLHVRTRLGRAPFTPEPGAYADAAHGHYSTDAAGHG
ncbi:MAG: urease accessory protein UreE [Defluviicoccus sp.]